jgi:actin-related protein 2
MVQDIVVGTAASEQRQQLEVTYPISNGIVQNWEDMGHIWDHTFYDVLKVSNGICLAILCIVPT